MKFETKKEEITKILKAASQFAVRSNIDSTSCVYMEADNNTLRIETNSLDIGYKTSMMCNVLKKGEAVLPCMDLLKIVGLMPEGQLLFERKGNVLHISQGKCKMTLHIPDIKGGFIHPEMKSMDITIRVSECVLKSMIRDTKNFLVIDKNNHNFVNCVNMVVSGNTICVNATDGKRLFTRKETVQDIIDEEVNISISANDLLTTSGLMSDAIGTDTGIVEIGVAKNLYSMKFGTTVIIGRIAEIQYPDFSRIFTDKGGSKITFQVEPLIGAAQRCEFISSMNGKGLPMVLDIADETRLSIASATQSADETIIADEFDGTEEKIGMRPTFLLDVLQVFPEDEITIQYKDGKSPLYMESDGYLFVTLPVKLSA